MPYQPRYHFAWPDGVAAAAAGTITLDASGPGDCFVEGSVPITADPTGCVAVELIFSCECGAPVDARIHLDASTDGGP